MRLEAGRHIAHIHICRRCETLRPFTQNPHASVVARRALRHHPLTMQFMNPTPSSCHRLLTRRQRGATLRSTLHAHGRPWLSGLCCPQDQGKRQMGMISRLGSCGFIRQRQRLLFVAPVLSIYLVVLVHLHLYIPDHVMDMYLRHFDTSGLAEGAWWLGLETRVPNIRLGSVR